MGAYTDYVLFGTLPDGQSLDGIHIYDYDGGSSIGDPDAGTGNLRFHVPEPLSGDFDRSGSVDAADYIVWRKTDGSQETYNVWRANFGSTANVGVSTAAVPEPSILFALICYTFLAFHHHRRPTSEAERWRQKR